MHHDHASGELQYLPGGFTQSIVYPVERARRCITITRVESFECAAPTRFTGYALKHVVKRPRDYASQDVVRELSEQHRKPKTPMSDEAREKSVSEIA